MKPLFYCPYTDKPCDKCIYSTSKGECQYEDIAETIPTESESEGKS